MVRIVDYFSPTTPELIFRSGENYKEARQILQDLATSDGKVTRLRVRGPVTSSGKITNRRVYPGKRMKDAVGSWLAPFAKPVFRHHRSGKEGTAEEDPIGRVVSASYIQTAPEDVWAYDERYPTEMGTGFIELLKDIGDREAIEKILDKRYLTYSVGFDTDSLRCSICDHDWLKVGEPCEHKPGTIFTKKVDEGRIISRSAHLVTGKLSYEEVSFVNRPANSLASVVSYEWISDAFKEENYVSNEIPLNIDSLTINDIEYSTMLPSEKPVIEISDSQEKKSEITEEQLAEASILASMVESGILDTEQFNEDELAAKLAILEDAKLSTAQRKKLSGKTFCGPDRSFPVNDCAHVTAARRLIGRAKLSSSQKSRVLSCVNRKAKAMGCDSEPDSIQENMNNEVVAGKPAVEATSVDSQKILSEEVLDMSNSDSSKLGSPAPPIYKETSMSEENKTTDAVASEKPVPTPVPASIAAPVVDEVEALKAQLALKDAEVAQLREANSLMSEEIIKGLARRLLDLRIKLSDPLTDKARTNTDEYGKVLDSFARRSRISLEDAIKDEESRLSAGKNIPRGSVTPESAGVKVDTSKDEPVTSKKDSRADKSSVSAQEYKTGLASRLKGRG